MARERRAGRGTPGRALDPRRRAPPRPGTEDAGRHTRPSLCTVLPRSPARTSHGSPLQTQNPRIPTSTVSLFSLHTMHKRDRRDAERTSGYRCHSDEGKDDREGPDEHEAEEGKDRWSHGDRYRPQVGASASRNHREKAQRCRKDESENRAHDDRAQNVSRVPISMDGTPGEGERVQAVHQPQDRSHDRVRRPDRNGACAPSHRVAGAQRGHRALRPRLAHAREVFIREHSPCRTDPPKRSRPR